MTSVDGQQDGNQIIHIVCNQAWKSSIKSENHDLVLTTHPVSSLYFPFPVNLGFPGIISLDLPMIFSWEILPCYIIHGKVCYVITPYSSIQLKSQTPS